MASKKSRVRLSSDVIPLRYQLHLTPDLDAFVFSGDESIVLTLKKPIREITLHAIELLIDSASIKHGAQSAEATKISYDEKAETATLRFEKPIPKGMATLSLAFRGTLNDRMHGFYRSSYTHEGKARHLATTQFESTDARRAFPCFDEPAQKAIFEISLTVPSAQEAISNTLPIDIKEHEGGYKTVHFGPTPPMSTYLAAFIVGDFEYIEKKSKDGVLVRVFTTPGKKHQADFALDVAAKVIDFFNAYFDIPYPLPAVDLIAIPDFSAGAMENWGAITYRETALLVDPERTSTQNKQWIALVIAHELAHQWFGNLVTMEWWTHLWLNEGFASYIEYLAVDHIFPDWDMWTQFLQGDMRPALHADALKHTHVIEVDVHHPSEIASVFDAVSYSKGASIIRMLAEYLGEKHFRDGLRYYLKKHSYKNTETVDLWNALAKVSGKPVAKIMTAWTREPGYPLVEVAENKGALTLSQKRFFASPLSARSDRSKTTWKIPLGISVGGKAQRPILLDKKSMRIKKPGRSWVKLNANESSFVRTTYSETLREALAVAAEHKELSVRDRLGLIRDIFAVVENGAQSAPDALTFAARYRKEDAYVVWAEILGSLGILDSIFAHEAFRPKLHAFVIELLSAISHTYAWDTKPKDHQASLLKILILGARSKYGDAEVQYAARSLFAALIKGNDTIPADLRGIVFATVARTGGAKDHAALLKLYKEAAMHEEKNRIGASLGLFADPALLQKTLEFSLSKEVRPQDTVRIIAGVTMNPAGTAIAWKFMTTHWKTFVDRYKGSRELSYLLEPLSVSTSAKQAEQLEKFLKSHPAPGTERTVAQILERIRSNAAWLARDKKALAQYFA